MHHNYREIIMGDVSHTLNKTVLAGTYQIYEITLMSYEDNKYDGKSVYWMTPSGILLKNTQYDENDKLSIVIEAKNAPEASEYTVNEPVTDNPQNGEVPGFMTIIMVITLPVIAIVRKKRFL